MRAFKYSALGSILTLILFFQPTSSAARRQGPSASGHGNLTVDNGELRTFSFNAVTDGRGDVTGQAQVKNRDTDQSIHLAIDCLEVDGNRAVASGTIIRTNGADQFLGRRGIFVVQDNGQGRRTDPDTISLVEIYFPGEQPGGVGCPINYIPFYGEMPVEAGNIQVKP